MLVPGAMTELQLLLLNPGTLDASGDLVVRDVLPEGLAFVDVLSDGWSCAFDEFRVWTACCPRRWQQSRQTTLQLLLEVTATDTNAALVNAATLSSPSQDPDLAPPGTIDALPVAGRHRSAPAGPGRGARGHNAGAQTRGDEAATVPVEEPATAPPEGAAPLA